MKKKLLMTVIVSIAVFSACNNSDEKFTPACNGEEVSFFVNSNPITRTVVSTSDGSTQFKDGDLLGIYATGGATATNVKYNVNATDGGSLTVANQGNEITWTDATAIGNFYAYYPYAESNADGTVAFTVTNQTSQTDFEANDFLYAKSSATGTAVKFTFNHGLSLVKVVLVGDALSDATSITVKAQPTITWTHTTNKFATSGEALSIKMWKVSESSQEYWAVVPAQTFTSGSEMFKIAVGSTVYRYKPAEDKTLTQGGSTKFTLSIDAEKKVVAVSTDVTTSGWNTDVDQTGKLEKDPIVPVALISSAQGTFSTSTTLTAQKEKQTCVEGWNTVITQASFKDNAIIAFDNTESAMSLVRKDGAWHNGTLYYCTQENAAKAGKYTLKFKVKASMASKLQLGVIPCMGEKLWFYENGTTNTIKHIAATTEWAEKTFTFDLNKIKEEKSDRAATANDLKKVLVYFVPDIYSTTKFFIKDVTFIENVN